MVAELSPVSGAKAAIYTSATTFGASFRDYGPAVAVADENHWPGLSVDLGLDKLDVFRK